MAAPKHPVDIRSWVGDAAFIKTGTTKLNQLQVVVALLAFGLLAGASGSAAAAVGIEGQVQASGSRLANSTVTLWQASARA
jgi:hypothetical protein